MRLHYTHDWNRFEQQSAEAVLDLGTRRKIVDMCRKQPQQCHCRFVSVIKLPRQINAAMTAKRMPPVRTAAGYVPCRV
jgi:hypothetical protein